MRRTARHRRAAAKQSTVFYRRNRVLCRCAGALVFGWRHADMCLEIRNNRLNIFKTAVQCDLRHGFTRCPQLAFGFLCADGAHIIGKRGIHHLAKQFGDVIRSHIQRTRCFGQRTVLHRVRADIPDDLSGAADAGDLRIRDLPKTCFQNIQQLIQPAENKIVRMPSTAALPLQKLCQKPPDGIAAFALHPSDRAAAHLERIARAGLHQFRTDSQNKQCSVLAAAQRIPFIWIDHGKIVLAQCAVQSQTVQFCTAGQNIKQLQFFTEIRNRLPCGIHEKFRFSRQE